MAQNAEIKEIVECPECGEPMLEDDDVCPNCELNMALSENVSATAS